jgi:hypothetical protein
MKLRVSAREPERRIFQGQSQISAHFFRRKKMKNIYGIILAMGVITGSANAADFSFTGNFGNDDEVQEFHFAVTEPNAEVTLRTWSYAGGTNAAGTQIAGGGFDPIVTLFNSSTGRFIVDNDDSGLVIDPDTGNAWDSFLQSNLSEGNYTATITQYGSFASGELLSDGFQGTTQTNFGSRASHWALDILNAGSASLGDSYISETPPAPIPEPESYALLLAGLGLVTLMARRATPE